MNIIETERARTAEEKFRVAVGATARAEIAEEKFRVAVDAAKVKIRARRWWHALVPFTIVILRRGT